MIVAKLNNTEFSTKQHTLATEMNGTLLNCGLISKDQEIKYTNFTIFIHKNRRHYQSLLLLTAVLTTYKPH